MIVRTYFLATTTESNGEFAYYKSSWKQLNEKNITIKISPCNEEIPEVLLNPFQDFLETLDKTKGKVASSTSVFDANGEIHQPYPQNLQIKHANIIVHSSFNIADLSGHDIDCLSNVIHEISLLVRRVFPCINTQKSTFLIVQPNGTVFNVISRLKNPNTEKTVFYKVSLE